MSLTLVIGNKNYSSWSLRPWLAMKQAGIAFNEIHCASWLTPENFKRENSALFAEPDACRCLVDGELHGVGFAGDLRIHQRGAADGERRSGRATRRRARGPARVCAEMHSGFAALRTHMPMDIRSRRR